MAYTRTTWVDEVLAGAERFNIEDNTGGDLHMNSQITLATGITTAGTTVDAAKLNNIEVGLVNIHTGAALSVKGRTSNSSGEVLDIAAGSDGYVLRRSGTTLAFGQVVLAGMAANSVDSSQIVAGAVDLAHMSSNSVDSSQIVAGAIDAAHMAANSVDSGSYVDASIDYEHLSSGANKVTSRQGGSATNWSTVGDTNYTPTSCKMECGVKQCDGSGDATVTFPVAFAYVPIVFVAVYGAAGGKMGTVSNVTTTQAVLHATDYDGTPGVSAIMHWIAIGPE